MKLWGYTLDRNGVPITGASVEIKDARFQTLYSGFSDELGRYEIEAADDVYPFVIAVKDYGINNLEYWCQNVNLCQDLRLDARLDKLELYGLHAFFVKGGLNAMMVYFRPMSLVKFQTGESDIAPQITRIKATKDGREETVLLTNPVKESNGEGCMTAYLIQIENSGEKEVWGRVDIEIWDTDGHYGAATIFNH